EGVLAMNSWQVAIGLAFLIRTMTFALPEVLIAYWSPGERARLLWKFCLTLGSGLTALMLLLGLTGLDALFFRHVIGADPAVAAGAHTAFLCTSLLPVMTAATNYTKGVLTAAKVTVTRTAATGASVLCLLTVLAIGVKARWPGVVCAAA